MLRKPTVTLSLLACAVALSACQSQSVRLLQTPRPQMPPLPAAVATKREPNLTQRLQNDLQPSPTTATTQSDSSMPASTSTTR